MEDYGKILHEGNIEKIQIASLPDAKMFVGIDDPKARQLADLALHKSDLEFVINVLNEIGGASSDLAKEALWQIAIVKFIKCYVGGSARIQLDERVIFRGNDTALKVYRYFKSLRDKHFIHDENSYTQATVAAALNGGSKTYKIEKIIALSARAVTLSQANYDNLFLAANDTLKWVREKFESLCNALTNELEQLPYETLSGWSEISIGLPDIKDIDKRRAISRDRPQLSRLVTPKIEEAYWVPITDGTQTKWTQTTAAGFENASSIASRMLAGTRWRVKSVGETI